MNLFDALFLDINPITLIVHGVNKSHHMKSFCALFLNTSPLDIAYTRYHLNMVQVTRYDIPMGMQQYRNTDDALTRIQPPRVTPCLVAVSSWNRVGLPETASLCRRPHLGVCVFHAVRREDYSILSKIVLSQA